MFFYIQAKHTRTGETKYREKERDEKDRMEESNNNKTHTVREKMNEQKTRLSATERMCPHKKNMGLDLNARGFPERAVASLDSSLASIWLAGQPPAKKFAVNRKLAPPFPLTELSNYGTGWRLCV